MFKVDLNTVGTYQLNFKTSYFLAISIYKTPGKLCHQGPYKKSHFNLFFAQGRCFPVDGKWVCQTEEFYGPINRSARLYSVYIVPSRTASLTGTKSALNKVQSSLGQLTDSLCQAPPGLGRARSRPCETPRRVGRCSGSRVV